MALHPIVTDFRSWHLLLPGSPRSQRASNLLELLGLGKNEELSAGKASVHYPRVNTGFVRVSPRGVCFC